LIKEKGMTPPLAHAPYTYNPCSKDEGVRDYSRDSMRGELEFLESIPGSLYNFHPGCHVGQGVEAGVEFISGMLDRVLWNGMSTTVLLETMAGKGTEMGRSFEELRMIIDRVDAGLRDNLGVCLDTCHVHDAGYDLVSDLDGVLREFDRVVGIDRLRAIHLNDSMNPRESRKDRHAKIGEGYIGREAISAIINHPSLRALPFYLETPNDLAGYEAEIELLHNMRNCD
ncbi:MAG: deoxyribonuclease IV, partial [Clostridia bacterium]|nr:deoxyribonuclease IV [Clostridia bacterium]